LILFFFLLWLLFNARLSLDVMVAGVFISLAVYSFCHKHMGYGAATDKKIVRGLFLGVRYIAVLLLETIKSNVQVSRIVFARNIEVEPRIIFFHTKLKSEAARVALANSITLTPGTITVALHDDLLCVHCLNKDMAEGIDRSAFVRLLEIMEKEAAEGI